LNPHYGRSPEISKQLIDFRFDYRAASPQFIALLCHVTES
jgi:hypothetical protein